MNNIDLTVQKFLTIPWLKLPLEECKQAAFDFMDTWDWQEKVPTYKNIVMSMTSQYAIYRFMKNCAMKGWEYKAYNASRGK